MEEEPRTERSSAASSSQHLDQAPADPDLPVDPQAELLVPSFSPPSAPSSPGPTGTLSRLSTSLRAQAQAAMSGGPTGSGAPLSPTDRGQVSAITVVALLDKVVNMLESVQENQQRMEQRQAELEGAVRTVQGDVTRLSKVHLNTANNVNKLLERSRKVSGGVKEVKERLEKQATQVKRLENNHAHLLKRNHFKVLIFQEDNEIPTDVFVKDSLKGSLPPFDEESGVDPPSPLAPSASASVAPSVAGSIAPSVAGSADMCSPNEGLHNVTLSSDEEDEMTAHQRLLAEIDADSTTGLGSSRSFERRSDRFKRNSLKKVDSLMKAFSKQNIEKKVNQITTKIVPPEKREKIIKSFTPNHPKSPTAKTSSFKVSPMTFNVKKVRDGQTPVPEASPPVAAAHVEIPALGLEEPLEVPGSAELRDGAVKAVAEVREALSEVGVGEEISVNGEVNGAIEHLTEENNLDQEKIPEEISQVVAQVSPSLDAGAGAGPGLAVPESLDDVGEDEEEEEAEEEGPAAAEPAITAAVNVETPAVNIAVEQAS